MTARIKLFLWLFALASGSCLGQDTLTVEITEQPTVSKDSARLARKAIERSNYIKLPYIGVGVGVLNYFGELDHNARTNPLVNSYGFHVSIIQNLSPSFGLKFQYTNARITVNREDGPHYNFRTGINAGDVQVFYNFARLLPVKRVLNPFIGIGIGTFNFSTKGDLKDVGGNRYYYYDDGRIMSIAEGSEFEEDAIELIRDHTYETDLRQENLDGLGKYSQFALTIPATIGLNLRISTRASFNISSTLLWTSTDLIDNISSKGEGDRKGDDQNDMILYNSVSFYYDFLSSKKEKSSKFDKFEFFSLDGDSDGDGIIDMEDLCPNTPQGAKVSDIGCPLDTDSDGVPDFEDEEASSDPNYPVDKFGVSLKDSVPTTNAALDSVALARDIRYVVYPDMARMYNASKDGNQQNAPINIKYDQFDLDGNGVINVQEVYSAIEKFFDGELPGLTPKHITGLIDYFFDQ